MNYINYLTIRTFTSSQTMTRVSGGLMVTISDMSISYKLVYVHILDFLFRKYTLLLYIHSYSFSFLHTPFVLTVVQILLFVIPDLTSVRIFNSVKRNLNYILNRNKHRYKYCFN